MVSLQISKFIQDFFSYYSIFNISLPSTLQNSSLLPRIIQLRREVSLACVGQQSHDCFPLVFRSSRYLKLRAIFTILSLFDFSAAKVRRNPECHNTAFVAFRIPQ